MDNLGTLGDIPKDLCPAYKVRSFNFYLRFDKFLFIEFEFIHLVFFLITSCILLSTILDRMLHVHARRRWSAGFMSGSLFRSTLIVMFISMYLCI